MSARTPHRLTIVLTAIAIATLGPVSTSGARATPNPCANASARCLYGVPRPAEVFGPASTSVARATPDPCADASARCLYGVPRPTESFAPTATSVASAPSRAQTFQYGDAAIGAAAMLGLVLVVGGLGTAVIIRSHRRRPSHA
jgi:hypothetical protein